MDKGGCLPERWQEAGNGCFAIDFGITVYGFAWALNATALWLTMGYLLSYDGPTSEVGCRQKP